MNRRTALQLMFATSGLAPLSAFAQKSPKSGDSKPWPFPWQVGEVLEYHIHWGFAGRVGTVFCRSSWVNINGKRMIALRINVTSNKIISSIYPIRGLMESIVDPDTFLPIRFTKNMHEGKRHTHEVTEFDWTTKQMTWKSLSKKRAPKVDPIRPDTRDILAFMYFFRSRPMAAGKTVKEHLMMDEKLYDLDLNYRKVEEVKLKKYGKVKSVKVEPRAKEAFNGLFVKKGDMDLWVSTGPRKVCTLIEAETPFANVKIRLYRITGPGDDFWIKKGK